MKEYSSAERRLLWAGDGQGMIRRGQLCGEHSNMADCKCKGTEVGKGFEVGTVVWDEGREASRDSPDLSL